MRFAFLALAACSTPHAPRGAPVATRDGAHDFDFELGTWRTKLRRLTKPLTGSSTWVEYEGTTVVRPVWGGKANLVELDAEGAAGHIEALSLRLYDPETRSWSLNFASSRSGEVSPPSIGSFTDGRGTFFANETLGDRPIRVRFIITPSTDSIHFEQAFSADDGKTWEVNWIADDTREQTMTTCCPILELRQYTLHPGKRDTLIDLFDREFVETQEAEGIHVVGQFRDTARPDRFVWMRGWVDMAQRARSLAAFYGGPAWKTHREAANATMIDSDNVLLLRPVGAGFTLGPRGGTPAPYAVTIYSFKEAASIADFERALPPGGVRFMTEDSANTFPALPVREGEHVLVVFGARASAMPAFAARFARPPETLELVPTPRSRLR
jgi:quinol monooxygenase YgiN